MQLRTYLSDTEKQYHLRLKTVVPLDDDAMDRIELAVAKYFPVTISKPKKTIIQRQPMEFPNVQNAEVYIVDLTFALPAAPAVIAEDIRKTLAAPEDYVVVRNWVSPGELDIEQLCALADIEEEAAKRGLHPVPLMNDPDYNEIGIKDGSILFGNAYNAAFLNYLADVQKERQARIDRYVNAPMAWLDLPDRTPPDNDAFNQHIADAPRVAPVAPVIATPDVNINPLGHFERSQGNTVRRLYADDNGKRVVLSRTLYVGDDA